MSWINHTYRSHRGQTLRVNPTLQSIRFGNDKAQPISQALRGLTKRERRRLRKYLRRHGYSGMAGTLLKGIDAEQNAS